MLWWTIQKLKSSDWHARAEAARSLAAPGNRKAVPALIRALESGAGEERPAVIEALGIIGDQAAVDPLTAALKDQHTRLRNLRGRDAATAAAGEYKSMAEALAKIGSAALNPLLGLLDSDDKDVRRWAAHALGLLGDATALIPLVDKLQDPRSEVRQSAARALGGIADRRTLQPLIKTLAGRDPEVRGAAAEALGVLGVEEAVDPLAAAARDANEPLQLAVIEALRRIGGLQAGVRIRGILEGAKKTVRDAASAALASMTFDAAIPENRAAIAVLREDFDAALREGPASANALISALGSRDPDYRLRAVRALETLRCEAAIEPLLGALDDSNRNVQEAAAQALTSLGTPALAGLVDSLKSEHLSVLALAARALGGIGDVRAIGPLVEALAELQGRLRDESGSSEAGGEVASALAAILSKASALAPKGDLARLAALSERESRIGTPTVHDSKQWANEILRLGELAQAELRRRGVR